MRNRKSEFILLNCAKRWPILKCRDLEIGLEFELNGFSKLITFSKGSLDLEKTLDDF